MLRILTLLILILPGGKIFAHDLELSESAKCVNFFRYYERKLGIPEDALYSISLNETGKKHSEKKTKMSWPWSVNVEGRGYYFDSKREAVHFVKQQLRDGKESIDVGCMQINLKHHPKAFSSVDEAFNPKHNIEYAANFLVAKFKELGTWGQAIAHYHSATPHLGSKYKKNVIAIAQNIDQYKSAFKREKNIYRIPYKEQTRKLAYNRMTRISPVARIKRYRSDMMIYIPHKQPQAKLQAL